MVLQKEITFQIKDLLQKNPQGLSITDIVKAVQINRNTAGRYLENLLVSGQVDMRRLGMAKIYMLTQRVPLSAVLSISSDLVVQLDSSLRIIFANEPFFKLIGTEGKNLLGKNIEYTPVALVFDEIFIGFIENIRQGIAGREWSGEITLIPKDTILFCRIAPTVFEDGRKGVSVILEDITQRKRGETALLESEAKLRSIAENSPDLILLLNPKLEIIFISKTYELNSDQVNKRPVFDFIPREFHPAATACFEHVLKTGTPAIYGTEHHFASGNILYFESTVGPVFKEGRLSGLVINARDITERKKAEQKIEESERQFRLLAENSLDMIGRIKPDYTHSYVSPAYQTTLGYLPEEIIGKSGRLFIHPEDAHVMESVGNILTPQNSSATIRFRAKHKDGHYIWIESTVRAIFDEKTQELSEYYAVTRDITERKTAEKDLQESEDRYRKLIEISPDAVLLHIEGKITYLNQAALHMLGAKDSNEILGKNVLDLIHPDFRDTVRKNIEKDLTGETTPPTELYMLRVDGTMIVAEGRGVKTTFNGKPAIQVAIRDTTERKRVETELRESEEKYRTLVNRANDVICVIQDGVIKMCNPRLPEFWERSDEDITGRPFTDFVHPDALSKLIDIYKRRISGESVPSIYETILMHKDGSKSFVEVNAGVIVYEGTPADLVIVRDINDRKKAEDALRESEATARALINTPTDSVILTDAQGIILAMNETAASRFGRRPEELVGILTDDLLPEEVAQSRRLLVSKMLETKTMVRFEDERDGRWYDTVAYPIVSENGIVTRFAIISRDITDRRNTEKALIESEERYRQLVDISPDAVLLQREGKIVFANPAALNLLGAAHSAEIMGKNVLDFIQPESHDTVMNNREKDLGGEITLPIELHMLRIDGTPVIVEGRGVRTFIEGKPAIQIALRERLLR